MSKFWIINEKLAASGYDVSSCDIVKWDTTGTKYAIYATVYGKVPTTYHRNVVGILNALEAVENAK